MTRSRIRRLPPPRPATARPGPRSAAPGGGHPAVRVRDLAELAATVPYLLGFVPQESVTCVALRDRQVEVTARVDLAAAAHPEAGGVLLDQVFAAAARTGASAVLVLVSSEAGVPDPVVLTRLRAAAATTDLDLLDVGWHHEGRCVSLLCEDPLCCPPAGRAVDPACAAAVAATVAGVVARPTRAAVESEFDRVPGADPVDLAAALAAHEHAVLGAVLESARPGGAQPGAGEVRPSPWMRGAATRIVDLALAHDAAAAAGVAPPSLTDADVAAAVVALAEVGVRDLVWLAVDAREVDGAGFWLTLLRRAPVPYDASPTFLLGWRSWRHGDGVRAVIAAERAVATPGGYSAAQLLLDAIDAGVDPRTMPLLSL